MPLLYCICAYSLLWSHSNRIHVCLAILPQIETQLIELCVCGRTLPKSSKFNAVMMCPKLREYWKVVFLYAFNHKKVSAHKIRKQYSSVCYCATVPSLLAAYAIHSFPCFLQQKHSVMFTINNKQRESKKLSIFYIYIQDVFLMFTLLNHHKNTFQFQQMTL